MITEVFFPLLLALTGVALLLWMGIVNLSNILEKCIKESKAEDEKLWKLMENLAADDITHASRIDQQSERLTQLSYKLDGLKEQIRTIVGLDTSFAGRDSGWLILMARVNGQDAVRLQELKPDMTMKEYQELVETLSYQFNAVTKYVDGPRHVGEYFLKDPEKLARRRY